MAKKQWSVEIGFNKFDGCPKKHKAYEICDGCRWHQGVAQIKVPSHFGPAFSEVIREAAWRFSNTKWGRAGYQIVTVTMDVDDTDWKRLPSPPRAAPKKRGGQGQRKA